MEKQKEEANITNPDKVKYPILPSQWNQLAKSKLRSQGEIFPARIQNKWNNYYYLRIEYRLYNWSAKIKGEAM